MRKSGKILGAILLGLVLLEGALRLPGLFLFSGPTVELGPMDREKFRILTLGESTTDPRAAGGRAWPEMLESFLIQEGIPTKVYNLAQSGTNSALLAARMERSLTALRPHMVIGMIGINDTGGIRFDHAHAPLKILKLLALLKERIDAGFACALTPPPELDLSLAELSARALSDPASLPAIERDLRRMTRTEAEIASALSILGRMLNQNKMRLDQSAPYFRRALELDPLNALTINSYLLLLSLHQQRECLDVARSILKCAPNLTDQTLAHVVLCYQNTGEPLDLSTLKGRGLSVHSSGTNALTENYRSIARLALEAGGQFVAVQYPTLPLSSLKSHFSEDPALSEKVVFVSNEENFNSLLAQRRFEEVFKDRFRGSWGHTTPLGHEAIARAVFAAVLPVVRKTKEN